MTYESGNLPAAGTEVLRFRSRGIDRTVFLQGLAPYGYFRVVIKDLMTTFFRMLLYLTLLV